ncbi:MAG: chorismate lyase [Gammaproteobacteria bacterium]|jgi:chorismate-pyruvate lyase
MLSVERHETSGRWSRSLPASLPAGLAAWLADGGLLTPRMRSFQPSSFRLSVHAEYRRALREAECRLLDGVTGDALVREISMGGAAGEVVVAESVIPVTTLDRFPRLGTLGEQPLGEALARLGEVRRSHFEYAVFEPGEDGFPTLPERMAPERLFARRSVIRAVGAPILVLEYFTAALATPGAAL